MSIRKIEPVEWTSGVTFVKVPTEMLDAITRCETQGHVDKLCGAYVRYCMSQKREEVPNSIREQYNMLIPIADKFISGRRHSHGTYPDGYHSARGVQGAAPPRPSVRP